MAKAKTNTRLRTTVGLRYPVGDSLKKAKKAGGLSKMTNEERAELEFKDVPAGGYCDDYPKGRQLDRDLKSGKVYRVDEPEKKGG